MNSEGLSDWPDLFQQVANAGHINGWATATLIALAAITALRFMVKTWRWDLWPQRIFWLVYLFLLPLSLFAAVHVIGVLFDAPGNPGLLSWLERGGDACLAIVLARLIVEGLDLLIWKGYARKKFGHATPSILIGVSAFLVYFKPLTLLPRLYLIFRLPARWFHPVSYSVSSVCHCKVQSPMYSPVFLSPSNDHSGLATGS